MSLGSGHEFKCDFLDCRNPFDQTGNARVAALRNCEVLAFCKNHSAFLLMRGVNLRTLEDVNAEYNRPHGIQLSQDDLFARRLEEFVNSLRLWRPEHR